MVSVCGVMVATVAMICTLSVYNGFKDLTTTLFSVFDPELKITSVEGKVFDPETQAFNLVRALPEVELCSGTLQENALVRYGERQEISVLKGVDSLYRKLAMIDTAIIDGTFRLEEGDTYYGVLGIGLSYSLGVNAAFAHPIEIFMPKRKETVNLANPSASSRVEYVLIGGVYRINQPVYDEGFMLVPLGMLREMLEYDREVSALEIKTVAGADVSAVKKKIADILGGKFTVKDRFEQQEATFKMVQIEKWVTFLMMCFILVMALFNVLGSLAILMIEKEEDVSKLRSMGADNRLINRVFLFEGWMISLIGAVTGLAIGLTLCFIQQRFGIIALGDTEGAFIVDAYPVKVEWADVIVVFLTVVATGFIAAFYPVHFLGKKWIGKKDDGLCALAFLLLLASCGGGNSGSANKKDTTHEIAVTIEPIRYFAEKIAQGDYKFFTVVPAGQGPETYDPSPREIVRFGKSVAYLQINMLPVETKLSASAKETNPKMLVADLSEGMNLHAFSHHHGGKEHKDPHIWTSFNGARIMSGNICKALLTLNPERAEFYKTNYISLLEELKALEDSLHRQLDALQRRSFVIYHPALTYFANEFYLRQLSIEEDGKEPSPASLKALIEEARRSDVKVVFIQKEFDAKYAEQIAVETGARVVVINPLDYQWDINMTETVKALVGDE
jgi:ABC-type Zn uptake system ZnuABC Zn-binding protein ZnuA/ABC-type lipoprotein release transport system permease subunit